MDQKLLAKQIGSVVRNLRLEVELSQEALAERCSLHRTYIGFIERGEKNVTVFTVQRLAEALGISLSRFFHLVENAPHE